MLLLLLLALLAEHPRARSAHSGPKRKWEAIDARKIGYEVSVRKPDKTNSL